MSSKTKSVHPDEPKKNDEALTPYKEYVKAILSHGSKELSTFSARVPLTRCTKCARTGTECQNGHLLFRCSACTKTRRTCSWKQDFIVEYTMAHFKYSKEQAESLYQECGRSLKASEAAAKSKAEDSQPEEDDEEDEVGSMLASPSSGGKAPDLVGRAATPSTVKKGPSSAAPAVKVPAGTSTSRASKKGPSPSTSVQGAGPASISTSQKKAQSGAVPTSLTARENAPGGTGPTTLERTPATANAGEMIGKKRIMEGAKEEGGPSKIQKTHNGRPPRTGEDAAPGSQTSNPNPKPMIRIPGTAGVAVHTNSSKQNVGSHNSQPVVPTDSASTSSKETLNNTSAEVSTPVNGTSISCTTSINAASSPQPIVTKPSDPAPTPEKPVDSISQLSIVRIEKEDLLKRLEQKESQYNQAMDSLQSALEETTFTALTVARLQGENAALKKRAPVSPPVAPILDAAKEEADEKMQEMKNRLLALEKAKAEVERDLGEKTDEVGQMRAKVSSLEAQVQSLSHTHSEETIKLLDRYSRQLELAISKNNEGFGKQKVKEVQDNMEKWISKYHREKRTFRQGEAPA